jgi:hypothetical protein
LIIAVGLDTGVPNPDRVPVPTAREDAPPPETVDQEGERFAPADVSTCPGVPAVPPVMMEDVEERTIVPEEVMTP